MSWRKWAAVLIFVLALLAGIGILWRNSVTLEMRARERWAEDYMASTAFFDNDYDALPTDFYAWDDWNVNVRYMPKLNDPDIIPIPENRLSTLMNTRVGLGKAHVKDPENERCRELFEKLTPYYERAFVWEPGTSAEECLERLTNLCDPDTMAEIDELSEQVADLCRSIDADSIYFVPSDSDLQVNP